MRRVYRHHQQQKLAGGRSSQRSGCGSVFPKQYFKSCILSLYRLETIAKRKEEKGGDFSLGFLYLNHCRRWGHRRRSGPLIGKYKEWIVCYCLHREYSRFFLKRHTVLMTCNKAEEVNLLNCHYLSLFLKQGYKPVDRGDKGKR